MSYMLRDVFLQVIIDVKRFATHSTCRDYFKKIQQKPGVDDYYILMGSVKPTMVHVNMCL